MLSTASSATHVSHVFVASSSSSTVVVVVVVVYIVLPVVLV